MANFDTSFFKGEYREGFYIEEMMKRAWAVEIDILEEIDRICKAHNIQYFADSGTLLGTVRHKGFIPWDDDVDIVMLREDYERFVSIAKEELPVGYVMADACTVGEETSRVLNTAYINFSKQHLEKFYGCPYIVGVDIFPLDNVPKNKDEEEFVCEVIYLLKRVFSTVKEEDIESKLAEKMLLQLEESLGLKFDEKLSIPSRIIEQKEKVSMAYQMDICEEVTLWDWFVNHKNYRFKREWYAESILMPFENIKIPVPKNYREVLIAIYGEDYLTPVKNTQSHEYPFYKKQKQFVESERG